MWLVYTVRFEIILSQSLVVTICLTIDAVRLQVIAAAAAFILNGTTGF